ncbi:hypothetical protein Tco_0742239, partial [Tanacetum coccineum]
MASLDYHLNPLFTFKECSSCGALYNKDHCYSVETFVRNPNETPDSSQQSLPICPRCGDPVDGLYCQPCALQLPVIDQTPLEESTKNLRIAFQAWSESIRQKKEEEEKRIAEELAAKARYWKIPICYDDDEDYTIAITPDLPITDSLIMEDEHLDTIPATESDELIKSSVENLVQIPSESEDLSDGECDLPLCDDSPKSHLTFSNPLFDIDDDFTSSDDESFSGEDVPMENFKIFSNPLFDLDEEIISTKVDQIDDEVLDSIDSIPPGIDSFDAESNLIESLLNRNTSIDSSSKIDSLLDEFAGELTLLKSIPPGIDNDNLDPEGEIHLVERLLYDNSSPRTLEELNVENSIVSFSPSPIPVEDSDSLMEEIDFESFHVDYPDSGDSTIDVVEDILVDVPNILPTHPTLHMDFDFIPSHNDLESDLDVSSPSGDRNKIYDLGICIEVESTRLLATHSPVIDTLLPFSSENKDKVFNHGVLASKEKSPPSSSHRGFKASKLFHQKSPMLIHGEDIPILDVPIAPDFEASRAHGNGYLTINDKNMGKRIKTMLGLKERKKRVLMVHLSDSYWAGRPIFESVWDHVNSFIPIGSEVEKDYSKPSEKETSKTVEEEKVEEEDVNLEQVLIEKKAIGIRRKTLARRRASDKQGQDSSKRQKKEKETADYEEEKDELRMWLTVVLDEEEFVDP